MTVKEQISSLLQSISKGVYEKEQILAMSLLSAVAGESIFLLGPPGTAKSLVSRRLKMAFKDAYSFEYLMSRFSTPDEIFGPVSISLLKNEDKYERLTEGYLPSADIVFLDEIWKAGPAIQNALLTAINEKIMQNGSKTISLPMKALIAASNELPAEGQGLEALWDRFLVRMVSDNIQTEATFYEMIRQQSAPKVSVTKGLLITSEKYAAWQKELEIIVIPDTICRIITSIRRKLAEKSKEEGVEPMDYYVSDRRWKKCMHLMQASALLNGRKQIDVTDAILLFHCLWNKSELIPVVIDVVASSIPEHVHEQLSDVERAINEILSDKGRKIIQSTAHVYKAKRELEYHELQNFPFGRCVISKDNYLEIDKDIEMPALLSQDNKVSGWIIKTIDQDALFTHNAKTLMPHQQQVVNIMKIDGGLIVEGVPYAFPKKKVRNKENDEYGGCADSYSPLQRELTLVTQVLRPTLQTLYNMVIQCENLFVSQRDAQVVAEYIKKCWDRLEQIHMKIANTQQLLS